MVKIMHIHGEVVKPPMIKNAEILEVSYGCSYGKCRYCMFYKNTKYGVSKMEDIREDLQEIKEKNPNVKQLFLLGGDPFSLPVKKLNEIIDLINIYLPDVKLIMYANINSMKNKSVPELVELKNKGVVDLVIGLETGDDKILHMINKGYDSKEAEESLTKLNNAGINYSIIYIAGLAGHGEDNWSRNALNTAKLINKVHPTSLCLTMLYLNEGIPLYDEDLKNGEFTEAKILEILKEYKLLLENINISLHIFNDEAATMMSVKADFPREKVNAIKFFDNKIESFTPEDENLYDLYRHSL